MLAHLGLGHPAKRKDDARKPLAVQVVEHVRLVLRRIDRRVKLWTGRAMNDPRVMSGGEPVKPELEHPPKHQVETDEGVAPQARIRRPTRQVRLVERLDHTLAELQLQVPAVIRNVEDGRDAPRIFYSRQGAASAVARRFFGVAARPLLQRHADDVMTLRLQQGGGDGRIDTTGHGDGDLHERFFTMCSATTSASSPTP